VEAGAGTMQQFQNPSDRRIDPTTQRQVIELAARLQERDRDHLSEIELEEMAAEAGLSREYVREALKQLSTPATPVMPKLAPKAIEHSPAGDRWFHVAIIVMIVMYAVVGLSVNPHQSWSGWLFVAALMAGVFAWFNRKRGAAVTYSTVLGFIFGMICIFPYESFAHIFFTGAGFLFGLAVHSVRQRLFPFSSPAVATPAPVAEPDDRLDRLERLRLLRGELESERIFGLYQRWVAGIVANHGGEIQAAAGDGAMAMFPNGVSAIRAARSIQRDISAFNQETGGDILVRCGVSEGPVAWRPGMAIGAIQSPIIDRAALRQRASTPGGVAVGEELIAEAAAEFGRVEATTDAQGDRVFIATPM
jgi:hypothetical protein